MIKSKRRSIGSPRSSMTSPRFMSIRNWSSRSSGDAAFLSFSACRSREAHASASVALAKSVSTASPA
jgi:hypothetical protein